MEDRRDSITCLMKNMLDFREQTKIHSVTTINTRNHAQYIFMRTLTQNSLMSYLDPLQVNWIHDGTLEEFYCCKMPLEQTFQFKVRWLPAHSNSYQNTDIKHVQELP